MNVGNLDMDFCNLYLKWLEENIYQFKVNDNIYRITLPFLDRNNDCIEIYIIKKGDDSFFITDDGLTLSDLESSGFNIFTSKRKRTWNWPCNCISDTRIIVWFKSGW